MANTTNEITTFSNLTKNRIASAKGWLLFCAILTLVLDGVVLAMLSFNTSDIKFMICPALLLLLDFLLLFKAIFSNYRFSYAIKGIWLHIVGVILVCAYLIISTEILSGEIVFTTFALYAMPAVHLIQCLAALINAIHAANKGRIAQSMLAVFMTTVFVLGAGVYGFFVYQNGFFGQSNKKTERTVVYSFDEANGYYVAVDLLKGFGNTVTIPETFNGMPVGGVDCKIFSDQKLSYVVFNCAEDIEFLNTDELEGLNQKLSYETTKEKLDGFRNAFYTLTEKNSAFLSLANHITPYDMESNQVYVTFCYDEESLKIADNVILPTWFGKKHMAFDVYTHAVGIDYVDHSDSVSVDDLYWCEKNQNSMIFNSVCNQDGETLNQASISRSAQLNVTFERIYQINIGEDNDTKYQIDTVYTSINTEDGVKPYKLATADRIMTVLEQIPARNGFDRTFKIGSDRHELSDIAQELSIMAQAGMTEINVYPHWLLRAPTITEIAADGKSEGHSAVYGSNVQLTSNATAPYETISVKYQWTKADVISDSPNYTINNIHPKDAGEYTLTVTAYADFTSLTSTAVKTVEVGFEKKDLHYNWILPADTVYSASKKNISAVPVQADIINGDTITQDEIFTLTVGGETKKVGEVLKAGLYNINVSLTGDASTKYKIVTDDSQYELSIDPYPVYVQWGNGVQFEYDGTEKKPTASATGIGKDGKLSVNVIGRLVDAATSGKTINAGDYIATAVTTNTNYLLLDAENEYVINQKPISFVDWQNTLSFIYNSESQYPKVDALTGVIDQDEDEVLESIVYTGAQVNAGNGYTITMQLSNSFPSLNYVLKCDTTATFDITPKSLVLTLDEVNTPYTGTVINSSKFSFAADGVAKNDKIDEIVTLVYKTYLGGVEVDAVNVATGGYIIGCEHIALEKYGNYDIVVEQGTLLIEPKKMTIVLHDKEKTYDGVPFQDEYTFNYDGLISDYDSFDEVVRELDFIQITNANASTYAINAQINSDGMGTKYGNYDIEIKSAILTINRAPLTVTAIGTTKVYDGYLFNTDGFAISVDGTLYAGKTAADLGTPDFGGEAVTKKNAGQYTLSVTLIENDVNCNYDITYVTGVAVIAPKPITMTAQDAQKIYNGQAGGAFDFEVVAEQLAYGDTKDSLGKITYGGTAVTAKDAGVYTLTITAIESQNYIIGQMNTATFTIEKKAVIVTAVANSKTYDGVVGGEFLVTATGLVNGENVSVLGTPNFKGSAVTAKNAGQYTLDVEFKTEPKNYTIAQYNTCSFVITKAKVNISVDSTTLSKDYDGKTADLDSIVYTVNGLCGEDTAQMLGAPQYSGSLMESSVGAAGVYTLTVTLLGNENYEESSVTVSYTIKPKEVTVTAVAVDRVYDGTAGGEFSIVVDGLVEGDDASVLGTPSFYGDAVAAVDAGTYTLQVALSSSSANYKVTETKSATFTITPKEVTVTAIAVDREYVEGEVGGEFSFSIDGIVSGNESDFTSVFSGSAVGATEKGTYELKVEITPKDQTNNYRFNYVDAIFTIS